MSKHDLTIFRYSTILTLTRTRPDAPIEGPVRLITKWIWEGEKGTHYKITKPDTDNLIKMLKGLPMTERGSRGFGSSGR